LLRATAAQVLPLCDKWDLTPARPWLTAARRLAGAGLLPLPEAYEPEMHLTEFRRLLPDHAFRIEVGLNEPPEFLAGGIAAIERSLLWISDILKPDVLLFVPDQEVGSKADLDSPQLEIIAPPLKGKPHPLSASEQKLAKWIAADRGLADLFEYNSLVQLSPVSQPCVDLLWPKGKLVVEIDDQSHWRKEKYAADRQRDFELISSGFTILRITADEVLSDTPKAIEKIRTCVELRR